MKTLASPHNTAINPDQSSLKTEWITTEEAAQLFQVSEGQIRNWTSNGKLPYYKLGRLNRYNRSELENLLITNRRGGFS